MNLDSDESEDDWNESDWGWLYLFLRRFVNIQNYESVNEYIF